MARTVTLHFQRKWSYHEDVGGNVVHSIPAQWIGALEQEPAAMAVAEGVAVPTSPLDAETQGLVDSYKAILELMAAGLSFEDAIATLEAEAAAAEPADDPDDGADAPPPAAKAPAKAPAKASKKKATAG